MVSSMGLMYVCTYVLQYIVWLVYVPLTSVCGTAHECSACLVVKQTKGGGGGGAGGE